MCPEYANGDARRDAFLHEPPTYSSHHPSTTGWTLLARSRHDPRVPEIRVDTIGDLAPGCAIYAFCDSCRRSGKLNLVKLRMQYGPGLLLDDLKRCVTCRRCTQRTAEIRLVNSAK